jgi:hypothetical protein
MVYPLCPSNVNLINNKAIRDISDEVNIPNRDYITRTNPENEESPERGANRRDNS